MSAVTIVLNRNFQPISTKCWEDAITDLFQGKAVAVDTEYRTYDFADWLELSSMMKEWPNGFASSEHMKIAIPEAIKTLDYAKVPDRGVVFSRRNLLEHYGHKCSYCGKKFKPGQLNYEHVIPKDQGGGGGWTNIVPSCFPCNTKKRNRTPKEAGMPLLVPISAPKYQSVQTHIMRKLPKRMRISWQHIIDEAYWNVALDED